MATKNETKAAVKKILLISTNPFILEATRNKLTNVAFLHLISKVVTRENISEVITENQPDVILLDFEFHKQPYDLIVRLKSEYPGCPLISILPEDELDNSERVISSGAKAFILFPYQADILVVTIKRVMELTVRKQDYLIRIPETVIDTKPRNTFMVFSPKGGAGTTSIAINLAISLHKTLKQDVLLIDGKHHFGHVAMYLNLHTGNSITDLLTHVNLLDERMIKQVAIRHNSGVQVLPSPNSIIDAQGIKPENLFKMIQKLQEIYPVIIIDGGNYLSENAVTYMDSSDKILLVLTPDLASIRDVRQFMEIATTLSYPKSKLMYILNLTGRKADVRKEEIENILKIQFLGKIPADENLALSCLNEGVPILMKSPRHPISTAFADITADLVTMIQTSNTELLDTEKM